jgi:hypothetical protein
MLEQGKISRLSVGFSKLDDGGKEYIDTITMELLNIHCSKSKPAPMPGNQDKNIYSQRKKMLKSKDAIV